MKLQSIKLFSNFTEEELAILKPNLQEWKYQDQRTIYTPGEPSENLYIIAKGSVLITHGLGDDIITLAKLNRGHFFGERGLLKEKNTHQTEARASQEDTVVLKLSKDNFDKIKLENPQLGIHILHSIACALSNRLAEDTTRIAIISAISDLINEPENLDNIEKLSQEILNITLQAIPSRQALLGVYSRHAPEQLKIIASVGISPKHLPKELPIATDPYLNKLYSKDKEIIILSDRYKSQKKVFYAKRNLLARAIAIEGDNIGLIALTDKEHGEFTAQNSLMLQIIAAQISFAIEEARLRKESQANEELKREYIGI